MEVWRFLYNNEILSPALKARTIYLIFMLSGKPLLEQIYYTCIYIIHRYVWHYLLENFHTQSMKIAGFCVLEIFCNSVIPVKSTDILIIAGM